MTELLQYKRKVTSQGGEDGIIERIFQVMPPANKWCVEAGALDGVRGSNTYDLINTHQWSSVQIEASHRRSRYLRQRYMDNPAVHCICGKVWFEGDSTMDRLLSTTPVPADFDLLSLDIDGYDYHVWDAMEKYRPKVVVIEFNPSIPDYVSYVQQKGAENQGSSLRAMTDLGRRKGYELICVNSINAFYVLGDCFGLFGIGDNSMSALWRNRGDQTHVFQLFDGTLMICGCDSYRWHRRFGKFNILDGRTNESIRYYPYKERRKERHAGRRAG